MDARSNKRQLSEQFPASAAESRSVPQLGPIKAPNCYDESAVQTVFQGVGVQLSGPGTLNVGGNLNFGGQDSSDQNTRCLTDLRATDPRHDKTRIEDTKGGLLLGSYLWVLHNADFQRWRDDEQSRLLWIKGDPGKGKTMLPCGVINELTKSTADTKILSFFFCQATDTRIND